MIRPLNPTDRDEWRRMRLALWPDHDPAEIDQEIDSFFAGVRRSGYAEQVFVHDRSGASLGGFVEVGRRPIAEECPTSPVGYLEGWYVDPDLREQGVGRALVLAAEQWARSVGCTEIASDCVSDNTVSHLAHQKLGYVPTDTLICFRKSLVERRAAPDTTDWIAIVDHDLSVGTAIKLVTDANAGGIDVFLGTTRAEKSPDGRDLIALDYEAYEEMALTQMRDLVTRARAKWPIVRIAFLHRVGRVEIGQPSVIIAVATPHRAESFEACRFIIDQLKVDVAIWKREIWNDGSGSWVHPE